MEILSFIKKIIIFFFPDIKRSYVSPPSSVGNKFFLPVLNTDGNWEKYLSQPMESQWAGNFDESNCTTQSGINLIETILNYYLMNNLLPKDIDYAFEQFFCNKEGFVKLSTRYIATMAGTTKKGLNMSDFWLSVNRDGIIK